MAGDKKLNIKTINCWKCKKLMKICWVTHNNFYGPERFSEYEISIAKENGVTINLMYSNTAGKQYNANICPHCEL